MSVMTREQVEQIFQSITEHHYPWPHRIHMLLDHDAAQRQRLTQLEAQYADSCSALDEHMAIHAHVVNRVKELEAEVARVTTLFKKSCTDNLDYLECLPGCDSFGYEAQCAVAMLLAGCSAPQAYPDDCFRKVVYIDNETDYLADHEEFPCKRTRTHITYKRERP